MEQKKRNNIEDLDIRDILSETRLEPSSNLKYRIMQQIQMEKALSKKGLQNSFSPKGLMLSIFGIMYAVLAVVGLLIYYLYGKAGLESSSAYMIVILIGSVCGVFWMLSVLDEKRRFDMSKRSKSKE